MEVIKCYTKVAMETIGEARNLNTKRKIAESQFASSNDDIVVDQLKPNAKNKNATKSTEMSGKNGQMKENSTLNCRSTSTKISIKSYKCFTLKYVPKMCSFIILLRIL